LLKLFAVINIQWLKQLANFIGYSRLLEKVKIGTGGYHKARGYRDAGIGHFTQIRSLTTDNGDIILRNLIEPEDSFLTTVHNQRSPLMIKISYISFYFRALLYHMFPVDSSFAER
jgi:hypothetical protein